jgi:hypothetical protein
MNTITESHKVVDICAVIRDGTSIENALKEARSDAISHHQMTGVPLVEWRDGKVVHVDPFTGEEVDPNDPAVIAKQRPVPYYLHAL